MSTVAAPNRITPAQRNLASPWAGFLRLVWKEYRAIRVFWLMLAGLSVVAPWLLALLWENESARIGLIYSFALGAPAFFAVACSAAAFAVEREEGTIDFLRTAPVSSRQVFFSKVAISLIGTVAMLAILLLLARLLTGSRVPDDRQWQGMLGLWLVAALEAIAWGTFFSLIGGRPLVAVVLTLVAVTTIDHTLARLNKGPTPNVFEWLAYLRAAPWRGAIALAVFGADIYLGLHWLDGRLVPLTKGRMARVKRRSDTAVPPSATERSAQVKQLLAKRDRSTMLGHLMWQQWRQSRSLIGIMILLSIAVPIVGLKAFAFLGHGVPILSMTVFSTLMGAMVFLPDQEQRRYRFFAEQNIPPRPVWLSRQLPWLAAVAISTVIVYVAWLFAFVDIKQLLQEFEIVMDPKRSDFLLPYGQNLTLPPLGFGIAAAATGYAVGQLFSMLTRSGILAAVLALVVSALLFAWAGLMTEAGVSLLWSAAPIPLVLAVATLVRTPDWLTENRRASARARISAILAVPAAAILIAVPLFRAYQIPKESPGFDVGEYSAQIDADLAEGMATAAMYGKASDLLSSPPKGLEVRLLSAGLDEQDQKWLDENEAALRILLEASARKKCAFFDPRAGSVWSPMYKQVPMVQLVVLSARRLEPSGDLDAALERNFAAINVVSHLSTRRNFIAPEIDFHDAFHEITLWGARKGQSRERIAAAIKRLNAIDASILRLDEGLKSDYLIALRAIAGDPAEINAIGARANLATELMRRNLTPWEHERATRLLNALTRTSLQRIWEMRFPESRPRARREAGAFINFCSPLFSRSPDFFSTIQPFVLRWSLQRPEDRWLKTTAPDLEYIGMNGIKAANRLAWFEADRRATIITLAIEEYRLDHGKLPKTLDELVVRYLDVVPRDPYSGYPFVYFPKGIAVTEQELHGYTTEMDSSTNYDTEWSRSQFRSPPAVPRIPGIWSTGAGIRVTSHPRTVADADLIERGGKGDLVSNYEPRDDAGYLKWYQPIWLNGDWFPIPEQGN